MPPHLHLKEKTQLTGYTMFAGDTYDASHALSADIRAQTYIGY